MATTRTFEVDTDAGPTNSTTASVIMAETAFADGAAHHFLGMTLDLTGGSEASAISFDNEAGGTIFTLYSNTSGSQYRYPACGMVANYDSDAVQSYIFGA